MSTDDLKRLGYGGSAVIDDVQVLMTSGGFDTADSIAYVNPLSVPPSQVSRSKVKIADGTAAFTGTVAFDVTSQAMGFLTTSKLLARRYKFDVGINDGDDTISIESSQKMTGCYLTSLTLSGAAGGLITASLGFMGPTAPAIVSVTNAFIRDQVPLGYWYSGNTSVRDWSFTMSQDVTPMFGNLDQVNPTYLKVGLISYNLQVTTFERVYTYATISISTSSFTLTGNTTAKGFSYGGETDLGHHTHTFETAPTADLGSDAVIIT